MVRTGKNTYRLSYDDFWSTGIWVGLRIFLFPAIVFCLFYFGGAHGETIRFESAPGLLDVLDLPSLAETSGGARFVRP